MSNLRKGLAVAVSSILATLALGATQAVAFDFPVPSQDQIHRILNGEKQDPVDPQDVVVEVGDEHEDGTTTIIVHFPGGITSLEYPTILIPPQLRHGPRIEEPPASGSQGEVDWANPDVWANMGNCYDADPEGGAC